MIVYVESNFLLAIARQQEESAQATTLLELAERGEMTLLLPAFAVAEPFAVLRRAGGERNRFVDALGSQLDDLQRSRSNRPLVDAIRPLMPTLLRVEREEMDRLEAIVGRLLGLGTPIALDATVFRAALELERALDLPAPDATILASVLADLERRDRAVRKCFLSTNSKDFGSLDVKQRLGQFNCRYIARIAHAVEFAKSAQ